MAIVIRVIVAMLSAVCGFILGFGAVALVYLVMHLDAGIGGGLIALLAGIIGGIAAAVLAFIRLGP